MLMHLLDGRHDSAKTIEFRQHAAVTRTAETLPWIDFVTALVKYAHENSVEEIRQVCTRAEEDPKLTLEIFLMLLPMNEDHMFYYLDRGDGLDLFFDHEAARAEVENVFGDADDNHPLRKVALELIKERKNEYDHDVVGKAVSRKFEAGGYGQFSRDFIDVYAPHLSEEEKVKLTIGWETTIRSESPEPEFEDEFELESEHEHEEPGPENEEGGRVLEVVIGR